jgi:hypothetical protein
MTRTALAASLRDSAQRAAGLVEAYDEAMGAANEAGFMGTSPASVIGILAPFMKHAQSLASWVQAALECDSWNWDGDQFDAALSVLNDYRKEFGDEPITAERIFEIRRIGAERRGA